METRAMAAGAQRVPAAGGSAAGGLAVGDELGHWGRFLV